MDWIIKTLLPAVFCVAVFITGFAIGISVKVFMVRGAPIIQGGGEIMLFLVIPAAVYIGYRIGNQSKNPKNMEDKDYVKN